MVRGFDAERQEWVDSAEERWIADLHRRAAARQRQALLVTLVVLAVCGLGFGMWALGWKDEPRPHGIFHPRETEDARGGTGDSPSPSPSSPPAVPSGYQAVSEDEFSTVVPGEWRRRTEQGQQGVTIHFFEEPGGGPRMVEIFPVTEEDVTPLSTLELAERSLSDAPGYQRNGLKDVDDQRGPAAELDYSYDSDEWGTRMQVLDRVVQAEGDRLYVVLVAGPADAWPEQREIQQNVLAALCFGTTC